MWKWSVIALSLLVACGEQKTDTQTQTPSASGTPKSIESVAWVAPQGWVEEAPASSMRKAQYRLPLADGDTEDAAVLVFYFKGEGGGVESNINRWTSWFVQPDGRPSMEAATVATSEVNGLKQTVVDVSGTYLFKSRPMATTSTEKPGFRMLGAVVEVESGPWFVRCIGPEKTVAKWEGSFQSFMGSFRQAGLSEK